MIKKKTIENFIKLAVDFELKNDGLLHLLNHYLIQAVKNKDLKMIGSISDIGSNHLLKLNKALITVSQENIGSKEIIEKLLKMGADINYDNGYTLAWAINNEKIELARYLIENNADIHIDHEKMIVLSVLTGNIKLVELLIANGADVNTKSSYPIEVAVSNGYLEITKLLIKNGAIFFLKEKNYLLLESAKSGQIEMMEYLLNQGAELNTSNKFTALIISSMKGYLSCVEYLIKKGADIHLNEEEALREAVKNQNFDIVKCLVENGADIHVQEKHLLFSACKNGDITIIEYLIKSGANIQIYYESLLIESINNNNWKVTQCLLEQGAIIENNEKGKEILQTIISSIEDLNFIFFLYEQFNKEMISKLVIFHGQPAIRKDFLAYRNAELLTEKLEKEMMLTQTNKSIKIKI